MSTFYILPPRPQLGERFAVFLSSVFPGLDWHSSTWCELADLLSSAIAARDDVFVIYGEELVPGQELRTGLADIFGAEAGDLVIEVQPGSKPDEAVIRQWCMEAAA